MRVIAIPNRLYPPSDETLSLTNLVLDSLAELTSATVQHQAA
jgi:hypothetical protein